MSFPRYPKYKDSGVAWLGQVPEHWDVLRMKHIKQVIEQGWSPQCEGFATETDDEWAVLKVGCVNGGTFRASENKVLPTDLKPEPALAVLRGDLLISRANTRELVGSAATVSRDHEKLMLCDKLYRVRFRPGDASPWFIALYLGATAVRGQLELAATGSSDSMLNITQSAILELPTACPPLPEQTAIAAFLDRETAKIDALVTEQERLIELLKEKRQAVISHAVTKGLNPDAPMKDSGVEWLGEIPAHWEVCRSRRMFSVRSEPALPTDRMLTVSQKYGVLLQSDFVEREGRRVVEVIMGIDSLRHVEPDDFIISMRSFQGGIEWCRLRGSTSFHYVMLKPIKGVHPAFFAHLFKSTAYIQALRTTTDLIRDGQELRFSNFAQVDLPSMPIDEQTAIARFLDREAEKLDALTTEAQRAIELLQERRKALISAAVTGQIDVRDVARRAT